MAATARVAEGSAAWTGVMRAENHYYDIILSFWRPELAAAVAISGRESELVGRWQCVVWALSCE